MNPFAAALLALAIAAGIALPSQRGLSDSTPEAERDVSTVVGTWRGGDFGLLLSFAVGGTAVARSGDGATYLGAWQADGEGGATFTFVLEHSGGLGEGFSGRVRPGDDSDELLLGESTLERIVPPTLEEVLADQGTPVP